MKWKIGKVEIENKVISAPMAGITNLAFRKIAKEMQVGLVYTEMISDSGLNYKNKKTLDMITLDKAENPVSVQLFGSSTPLLVKAAKYLDAHSNCDIIDINMGCPVNKVAKKSEAGVALMKNPEKVYEIVSEVVKNVHKPVTVKIRSGWDFDSINAVEIAKICEKAGAQAICVHPRTRTQLYLGKSDWTIIKAVKEAVTIPVIGNGDIKTISDAINMFEETKCDAIMIGRAALGNPWLYREIIHYLEYQEILPRPSRLEIHQMILKHFKLLVEIKGEKSALLEIRSHIAWYLKSLPNSVSIKTKLFQTKTKEELFQLLEEYFKEELDG